MSSQVQHQKLLAELELEQERLEELAGKLSELEEVSKTTSSSSSWVATKGGSFVSLPRDQVQNHVTTQKKQLEEDIRKICFRIQSLDSVGKGKMM
mmetsp:Transcript_9554/g.10608  ORF Transcript_9554/g.10608 Transcript_9554/m.10608 type:complete len:95 (+) Transcript_9554:39-323(+)